MGHQFFCTTQGKGASSADCLRWLCIKKKRETPALGFNGMGYELVILDIRNLMIETLQAMCNICFVICSNKAVRSNQNDP